MGHQLSMSFELICLLDWLLKNKKESLEKLIKQAIQNDFITSLDGDGDYENMSSRLHETVIEFVLFFEDFLLAELVKQAGGVEELVEVEEAQGHHKDIIDHSENIPEVHTTVDPELLTLRLHQARKRTQGSEKKKDVEKELLDRLLKRWKPSSNEPVN